MGPNSGMSSNRLPRRVAHLYRLHGLFSKSPSKRVVPLEDVIRELKGMGAITRKSKRGPYLRSPRAKVDLYGHYGLPKRWAAMSSSEKERMVRLFILGNLDHITPPGGKAPVYSFNAAYQLTLPLENQKEYLGVEVDRLTHEWNRTHNTDAKETIQNRINQLTDIQSVLDRCLKGLMDRSLRW